MRCMWKNKSRMRKRGFTLIEMLVVVAMLGVISLAIYTTTTNGIKIWQRINRQIPQEDLNIFFEKFATDLRNSLEYTDMNFLGKEDELEFPTLVNSPRLKIRTVGKIRYIYDYNNGVINRQQLDFSHIYNDENGITQQLLKDVKTLRFQYYIYDAEKKEYLWQEERIVGLPLAVRIELEVKYGTQTAKFTKTVGIPITD